MYKLPLLIILLALLSNSFAQNTKEQKLYTKTTVSGDIATIYIPRKIKIERAVTNIDIVIKQQLADFTQQMRNENQITDNVQTEVIARVVEQPDEKGSNELNLSIEFKYRVIKASMKNRTEDFPNGEYSLLSSNAARITMTMLKRSIEDQLTEYLTPGTKVTIRITGSTDGLPVVGKIDYDGEYGDILNEKCFVNGMYNKMSVTQESGIKTNEQLAFLRTYGVREFMETMITPLQSTKNNFEHYAVVSKGIGGEYRRISVELIIHDAFRDEFPETSENESVSDSEQPESDVDTNIPVSGHNRQNAYAVIIGNEDYSSFQTGLNREANALYAINDATIFKEYCIKTLGIPEKNITFRTNATKGQMEQVIQKAVSIMEITGGKAEFLFYFSGHGLPCEKDKEPYLIPVDISGSNIEGGIKLQDLYLNLTKYPSKRCTVFLDACFSGGARNESLLALKSVRIKPKTSLISGNLLVFSSSSGEESSGVYKEKKHGMFTYFLLKELKETSGNVTFKELSNDVINKVTLESINVNEKSQTPQIQGSSDIENVWETWKLLGK